MASKQDHIHPSDTTKQDVLVSGDSIKTVNGYSILGSGNIVVTATATSDFASMTGKPTTLSGYGITDAYTKVAGKGLSTEDYTSIEKSKLAGIAASANNYSLPIASAYVLGGVKAGANITIDAAGVISASASGGASATETVAGIIELATTAEAQSGTDAARVITPLQLFNSLKGSNQNLATNGYQKLHGGLIIQWGNNASGEGTATFPVAFPNRCLNVQVTFYEHSGTTAAGTGYLSAKSLTKTSFTYGIVGVVARQWLAVGY